MTSTKLIHFITGNSAKFASVSRIISNLEQMDIDVEEIQELDPHKVVAAKLQQALSHHPGPFLVDDTSLSVDGLGGLPGPLIKWFVKAVDYEGVWKMAEASGNTDATARCLLGYAEHKDNISYYEGTQHGKIVAPRGDKGFGWDVIFQPDGSDRTYAEMAPEEKAQYGYRQQAAEKLLLALS